MSASIRGVRSKCAFFLAPGTGSEPATLRRRRPPHTLCKGHTLCALCGVSQTCITQDPRRRPGIRKGHLVCWTEWKNERPSFHRSHQYFLLSVASSAQLNIPSVSGAHCFHCKGIALVICPVLPTFFVSAFDIMIPSQELESSGE